MAVTRGCTACTYFAKLMVLHGQILFSLAIAAIAEALLMQTSAAQVLSCTGLLPDIQTGHLLYLLAMQKAALCIKTLDLKNNFNGPTWMQKNLISAMQRIPQYPVKI